MKTCVIERYAAGYVYIKHIRTDKTYCGKWCVSTNQTKMIHREVAK